MKNLFSYLLMILGGVFLILSIGLHFQQTSPQRLSFHNYHSTKNEKIHDGDVPARVLISTISVDLPVIQAKESNSVWDTTSEGVSYLLSSSQPGTLGNSIFYGHNWQSLLGNLPYIKPGQKIVVYMKSGKTFLYTVQKTQEVKPTDTNILANSNDKRLTIYTCTGFLDSRRFVATAILSN